MRRELSHNEFEERIPKLPEHEQEFEDVLTTEQYEENGVILQKSVIKHQRVEEKFKDYKASDFSMHNLIAIGADKGLKEIKTQPSVDQMQEEMNNYAEQLNNIPNE